MYDIQITTLSSASNFIIVPMQMVRLTDRMGAEPFYRSNEVSSFTQSKFDGDVDGHDTCKPVLTGLVDLIFFHGVLEVIIAIKHF